MASDMRQEVILETASSQDQVKITRCLVPLARLLIDIIPARFFSPKTQDGSLPDLPIGAAPRPTPVCARIAPHRPPAAFHAHCGPHRHALCAYVHLGQPACSPAQHGTIPKALAAKTFQPNALLNYAKNVQKKRDLLPSVLPSIT
jgi:hypothetical protein